MNGLLETPLYCTECGKALIEAAHGFAQGFDPLTGEQRPRREWWSLDCPQEHQTWRKLGGEDGSVPRWYKL